MKKMVATTTLFAILGLSCKDPMTPHDIENVALSLEQVACVVLRSEMGEKEPDVLANLCAIPPSLIDEIVHVLMAKKAAKTKMHGGK